MIDSAEAADPVDLTGKVLIAMPGMTDLRFERAVILICAHSATGAMGLVLNKPMVDVNIADLLEQLDIDTVEGILPRIEVRYGGPVEPGRGFVLHNTDQNEEAAEGRMSIGTALALTTTRDMLEDIAQGQGPGQAVLALGYAGWGPGQLESELASHGWLVGKSADDLVFSNDNASKWAVALKAEGIDPSLLSVSGGRA